MKAYKKYKKHILAGIVGIMVAGLMYFFPDYFNNFTIQNKVAQQKDLSQYKEKDFIRDNCLDGITNYKLKDKTKIDCINKDYVIEFEYAPRWKKSIKKAEDAALKTGKKPAVAIIMENADDEKYIKKIRETNSNIIVMKIKVYK